MSGAQPGQDAKICFQARAVKRLMKGSRRIRLVDLAPAKFNRHNSPLSGKHVLSLAQRILREEGFATYRYNCGWCHEPDPKDPLAVSRSANEKAAADPILPRYPAKPLHGVFKCNHLVAFLQLLQAGALRLPGSSEVVAVPEGEAWEELHDVLEHGIQMEIWTFADVHEREEDFKALMMSDNFNAAFSLAEDEFQLISRIASAVADATQQSARASGEAAEVVPWAVVCEKVLPRLGNRWRKSDVERLFKYAQTTEPAKMDFLAKLANFMMDSLEFRIIPAFFFRVSMMPVKQQALRLAVMVAQISSDPDSECRETRARARLCTLGGGDCGRRQRIREPGISFQVHTHGAGARTRGLFTMQRACFRATVPMLPFEV